MTYSRTTSAVVPAIERAPAFAVPFPLELQWAVDLGVTLAEELVPTLGKVSLHSVVRESTWNLKRAMESGAALLPNRTDDRVLSAAVDAYLAGLLGRVQQHLIAGMGLPTDEAPNGQGLH